MAFSRHWLFILVGVILMFLVASITFFFLNKTTYLTNTDEVISMWKLEWPLPNSVVSSWQTFVLVPPATYSSDTFNVSWSVDGGIRAGELQWQGHTYIATVDTSFWDWNSNGEYLLEFIASNSFGEKSYEATVQIYRHPAPVLSAAVDIVEGSQDQTPIFSETNSVALSPVIPVVKGDNTFNVEWIEGPITGNQTFILKTSGFENDSIRAFWNSAGGHKNQIFPTNGVYETKINVNGWRWRGTGPYEISFSIVDSVTLSPLAEEVFSMTWQGVPGESALLMKRMNGTETVPRVVVSPPTVPLVPTPISTMPITEVARVPAQTPLTATKLFVPLKPAVERSLREASGETRTALQYIISQPGAMWLNGDGNDSDEFLQSVFTASDSQGTIPAFVLYNIPFRDCGSHSSGGAPSAVEYRGWIDRLYEQFKTNQALVIIEPDAIAQLNCAPEFARSERLELIAYAVETLSAAQNVSLYLDAGHPFWVNADEMANRLTKAGVAKARGFSLNVSNYVSTVDNKEYGTYLSTLLGGKHFVIDTSRNGNGPSDDRQWCNPRGRALGESSRLTPNNGFVDAYLWIKYPGESDGQCNGGPGAGQWWPEYATELYRNSTYR